MKKLFTLVALLAFFMGAKAETVVDYEVDYSTVTSWAHGWLNEEEHIKLEDGCIHFHSDEAKPNFYDYQYQLHPGIQVDNDALYTITIRIKGSVAQDIHASFSGSSTPGMIPIPTEWTDVVLENCVNDPNAQYFANSGCLLIQPGDYVGDIWIASIKITHEEKAPSRPVVWQQWLTDDGTSIIPGQEASATGEYMGDAEFGTWPAWSLEETDGANINWRGERTGEICAWALTMGRNFQPSVLNDDSDRARPFPADIIEEPGNPSNHVFVVDVETIDKIDDDNSIAWSNQFWIQSPQAWKSGTICKVSFKYKADRACTVDTQTHKINPSIYDGGSPFNTLSFTTEWQEASAQVTMSGTAASIAFNLTSDATNGRTPNKFYFDDLSWETMVLDEGYFVAGANADKGIEYDYDNAIQFESNGEEGDDLRYTATIGGTAEDEWVNEIMISTVRGHIASFKSNTLKVSTITGDDEDWLDYTPSSSARLKLPAAGQWMITIAPSFGMMNFQQIVGEEFIIKEPVDIVTNNTEITVNAKEREDLIDSKNNEGVITVNEDADDPEGVNVGGEGHNGRTYDNQFFIKANRALEAGEETVIEFTYSATKAARSTTQCHGENPGAYMHWNCIPAVEFTTEEQTYKQNFTVPSEANGMWCISFDLAVLKEANDYTFKDFKWYIKYDEEGKTMENLINETGDSNFYKKEGAGTTPYIPSGIFDVINDATTRTDVIYNLSGQRVSKDYKGIVIMNGRKVVNK